MFNFCHIELNHRNQKMDNGWWLLIDNEFALTDWFMQTNKFGKIWMDLKNSREDHENHMETYVLKQLLARKAREEGQESFSVKDVADIFTDMTYTSKMKYLQENGPILINRVGGFTKLSDNMKIIDELASDDLLFPETSLKDVNVSRFPNGTHYYVSINGVALSYKNKNKWDTYQEAKSAAAEFLKANPVPVPSKEDDFND